MNVDEGFHTFFPECESALRGVAQPHSQLSILDSEVCVHAHSLSKECEAVSSEYERGRLYQFQVTR